MLLHHYLDSRLAIPLQKIMITTDTHANRLYITHLLRICWYTSVHVEYLLYHLSLLGTCYFRIRETIHSLLHKGNKKTLSTSFITPMGWKCMTKICDFFEIYWKYGNKYWKFCAKCIAGWWWTVFLSFIIVLFWIKRIGINSSCISLFIIWITISSSSYINLFVWQLSDANSTAVRRKFNSCQTKRQQLSDE